MVAAVDAYPRLAEARRKLKDSDWNLRFRVYAYRRGGIDPKFARAMREYCRRDVVFWIDAFVWTYDPRRQPFSRVPMITYPFQERAVASLVEGIRAGKDRLIEKSRDMGASWLCLLVILWFWLFRDLASFLLGSRVQEYVDKRGNPKCLFWKLDFALEHMPGWLRPRLARLRNHLLNLDNGAVCDGEATTPKFARGDRRTAILCDEFAMAEFGHEILSATRDATHCRIFNSTHQGTGTAYYRLSISEIFKLRMHWSEHPQKNVGLYTKRGNEYVWIDREWWSRQEHPEEMARGLDAAIYRRGVPLPDGKLRSPWFAEQCQRAASAFEIAQELEIDTTGSSRQFFQAQMIEEYIGQHCCAPYRTGEITYDAGTLEATGWRDDPDGRWKLWMQLDGRGFPLQEADHSLGCDVSAGTGASNSTLSAISPLNMEKVLEYANPQISEHEFARLAVVAARWLGGASLIWEQGGPGRAFGRAVMETGYRNFFHPRDDPRPAAKISEIPGWVSGRETKREMLSIYRSALERRSLINRSELALLECLHFVYLPNGSVEHQQAQAKNSVDPSGALQNHGDRTIADALAWKVARRRPAAVRATKPDPCPPGSFARRRRDANRQRTRKSVWSS